MKRKKILVMSDSSKLHTGFGHVTKEIFSYLNRTKKYEIESIGWFHQDTNEDVAYKILSTGRDNSGGLLQEDKYAKHTFPKVVNGFNPDLVWTLGDAWMVDHVAMASNRKDFKWMGYLPIDGEPIPSKWGSIIDNMDIVIAYGQFGEDVMRTRAPNANILNIKHGVDTVAYHPFSEEKRTIDRKSLLGVSEDDIVVGIVARNQPRKAFDKVFEAYSHVIFGTYSVCKDCGLTSVCDIDYKTHKRSAHIKCKHCGSTDLKSGAKHDNVKLYVHAAAADCGWNLIDLQNTYDIGGRVLINPELQIGVGVTEETLVAIYNTMHIFTLPTRGEGFGLPILEAMSCGVPILVTDYSAHTEWCRPGGELIKPGEFAAEPGTNIRRAIVNMDDYVHKLIKLVESKELREQYAKQGREKALEMDWKLITDKWERLIDRVLYPSGVPTQEDFDNEPFAVEEL